MPHSEHYRPLSHAIPTLTLEEAIQELVALLENGGSQIDFLKTDCEGSECSFLGSASFQTLDKIRWIAGEYHDLDRFLQAIHRLLITHRVALIGQRSLGAFFAERRDEVPGLLCHQPLLPQDYPHLGQTNLTWHPFKADYVLPHERWAHGIGG
jgi:hypothetical protein